jgi:hypothetical protein
MDFTNEPIQKQNTVMETKGDSLAQPRDRSNTQQDQGASDDQ